MDVRHIGAVSSRSRGARAPMSWVTSRNDVASDVGTSMTNGRVASGNALIASRRSLTLSTRTPSQPIDAGDGGVVERVEAGGHGLLAHAVQHPAEGAVVEHEHADRQLLLDRGHQGVDRHGEAAVAAHRQHRPVGVGELGGHRRRHGVAHAAAGGRLEVARRRLRAVPVHHEQPVLAGVAA